MELKATVRMKIADNNSKIFYTRLIVPKQIRLFLAKPAIWRSLKTADVDVACVETGVIQAAFKQVLETVTTKHCQEIEPEIVMNVELDATMATKSGKFFTVIHKTPNEENVGLMYLALCEAFGVDPVKVESVMSTETVVDESTKDEAGTALNS